MQSTLSTKGRIAFIDALRGLAIVLMALDHVRDFFGPTTFNPVDLNATTPLWFLTRYITHFCAPVFVFLAGVGAALYGQTVSRGILARFLVTRGIWLVFLECTWVSLSWGVLLGGTVMLQVIWALGVAMVALAGLVYLPRWAVAITALFCIAGHNAFDGVLAADWGNLGWLWSMLHDKGRFALGPVKFFILYPVLPWVGVMAAGYLAAPHLQGDAQLRNRRLWATGFALLALMAALRWSNIYGDPHPWSEQSRGALFSAMSFINFEKYPPSLLYLCMTLGLGAWVMAVLARWPESRYRWLLVYGKVSMFFYLVHLPLIHIGAALWTISRYGLEGAQAFRNDTPPADYTPSLALVYGVWLLYLLGLYFACRWYGGVKSRRPNGLLRYL